MHSLQHECMLSYPQDVYCLDLGDVIILCVTVNLEHAVDEREFAERPKVQLFESLLVLQACQGLAQLIQCTDGGHCFSGLAQRENKT